MYSLPAATPNVSPVNSSADCSHFMESECDEPSVALLSAPPNRIYSRYVDGNVRGMFEHEVLAPTSSGLILNPVVNTDFFFHFETYIL